ncbi:MAG: YdcF family protein [Sphingobacteriales bacterium]|jgi:uncharacterized SAM-binding protein YcdF (DUF218 family)|nr:YdcF family protein [Sphingobacteriales bacterium]
MALIKNHFQVVIYFLLIFVFVSQSSCVSYKKRPARLYKEVIDSGLTFDAGIVPGYPFDGHKWDTIVKGRVLWAKYLYDKGIIRNIIFSGAAVYSPYYEAIIMGLYGEALGIPANHIFYDTLARHSTENIFYAYQLVRKQGFKSLALVTDPVQSSLTKRFTKRRFGTKIYHIPFVSDTLLKLNHVNPVIDPSSAFRKNFVSIKDEEKKLRRFRGTLGSFIPWTDKKKKRESKL